MTTTRRGFLILIVCFSLVFEQQANADQQNCCCSTGIDARAGAWDDFPRPHCDCVGSPPGSCHYREASMNIRALYGIWYYRLVPTTPNRAYIDLIGPNGTQTEADIRGRFSLLGPDGEGFAMYQLDWQGQTTRAGFNMRAKQVKFQNWAGQEQVLEFGTSPDVGVPPPMTAIRGADVQPSMHTPIVAMLMEELSPALDAMNSGGLNVGTVQQGLWFDGCSSEWSICFDVLVQCYGCSAGGGGGGDHGPDDHGHGIGGGDGIPFITCEGPWHNFPPGVGATKTHAASMARQLINEKCAERGLCRGCCAWRTRGSDTAAAPEPDCVCAPGFGDFFCTCTVWGRECSDVAPPP